MDFAGIPRWNDGGAVVLLDDRGSFEGLPGKKRGAVVDGAGHPSCGAEVDVTPAGRSWGAISGGERRRRQMRKGHASGHAEVHDFDLLLVQVVIAKGCFVGGVEIENEI